MMFGDYVQLAIIAVILLGIGVTVYKGGAANPVGTGSLNRKLSRVEADLGVLKSDFNRVETQVGEIDRRAATISDIRRIEARLDGWDAKIDKIDRHLGKLDVDLSQLQSAITSKHLVIEAMAESQRVSNGALQEIQQQVAGNASISARVPEFMENVLTRVAGTAAQAEAIGRQVDMLYQAIVGRGMK